MHDGVRMGIRVANFQVQVNPNRLKFVTPKLSYLSQALFWKAFKAYTFNYGNGILNARTIKTAISARVTLFCGQ